MTELKTEERSATIPERSGDLGVALLAAAGASVAWLWWTGPLGVELAVQDYKGDTQDVGLASTVVLSLVVALAGGGLLRWWRRRSDHALRDWTLLSVSLAVVSLLGPAGAVSFDAWLGLAGMHLLVAAVVIVGLRWVHRG